MHVSVCICTHKRPSVRDTVASVAAQHHLNGFGLEIVVCDDDPEQSARPIVESAAAVSRIPIRYVVSGASNVAVARNECVLAARGEWVAFIDDDEIADLNWLSRLLAVQRANNADVVKGYVRGVYPAAAPAWVAANDPYTRAYGQDGDPLSLCASGNVLFRRKLVSERGLRFDPQFGRSGGEDTDFFQRVRALGSRMVASHTAIVEEIVSPSRVTAEYFRRRYRRFGQTDGRKTMLSQSGKGRIQQICKAVVSLLTLWPYPVLRFLNSQVYFLGLKKFWYSLGMLEGLFGRASEEIY